MPTYMAVLWNPTLGKYPKIQRAASLEECIESLRSENNFVVDVRETKADGYVWKPTFRKDKIKLFTKLANTMQRATIKAPMYRDTILPTFDKRSKFYPIADSFLASLANSQAFRAMERFPQAFAEYEVNLMQTAGLKKPVETLRLMVTTMKQQERLNKSINKMLFWPALLTIGIIFVIGTFFVKLLPQMQDAAAAIPGTTLPWPLPEAIALEGWVLNPQHLVFVAAVVVLATLALIWTGATKKGRLIFDNILLRAGYYGQIQRLTRVTQVFFLLDLMQAQQYLAYDYAIGAAVGPVARNAMIRVRDAFHAKKYGKWAENLLEAKDFIGEPIVRGLILAQENSMLEEEFKGIIEEMHETIEDLRQAFEQWMQVSLTVGYGAILGGILYLVIMPLQNFIAHMK